jgi:hypothetical protein
MLSLASGLCKWARHILSRGGVLLASEDFYCYCHLSLLSAPTQSLDYIQLAWYPQVVFWLTRHGKEIYKV